MFINQQIVKFSIFLFCFSIFSSIAQTNEDVPLNNIAINETPKPILSLIFEDFSGNEINLKNYPGKLLIVNFWATWCAPCKKEMPSLDLLQTHYKLNNLKIFPINVGKDNIDKILSFYSETGIQNLNFYFDSPTTLAKKFKLRGIPTSILINKEGEEFARIIGSINFNDNKFIDWLSSYD